MTSSLFVVVFLRELAAWLVRLPAWGDSLRFQSHPPTLSIIKLLASGPVATAAVSLRFTVSLLLFFVVILLVHVSCDRCVDYISISSLATLACLSMCRCSVMPATAASTVDVDRVSLNMAEICFLFTFF